MPPLPRSRHLTLPCARCGRAAAEFALLPAGIATGGDFLGDRDRLVRTDFMGTVTTSEAVEKLTEFFDALARGDFRAAAGLDPDATGFYCPDCDAIYCEQCWSVGPPVFDDDFEGFYDYTEGTCPN